MYGNAYATAVNMCRPDQQHVAAALLEVIDKINQEVAKHTEASLTGSSCLSEQIAGSECISGIVS